MALLRVVPVLPEWKSAELPIYIVYLHRTYVPGKIREFVDYLVREVRNA
jgi:DNA-binding transcriptional LysR family regulator